MLVFSFFLADVVHITYDMHEKIVTLLYTGRDQTTVNIGAEQNMETAIE
jgi:hypothetical protein